MSTETMTVQQDSPLMQGVGTVEHTVETMTMAAALNRALADSMVEDPTVLIFGEDVGALGGVFRITDGLNARFGEERCFDTPLAESGIAGTAVGMAMNGLRPVIEMQFDAFAYPAFEQVVSHIAKMGNRTRGAVRLPMVIRIPYGGGIGGVEHHCDSSEAYYAHTPGLTVVTPSTPQEAYSLLRAAIASPDPVVFMEPKKLYWGKGEVDTSIVADLGKAKVVREGTDVTLISYGPSIEIALKAAEAEEAEGRSVQVVDVRTLAPFDTETIAAAVKSTGRAVVISEAPGNVSVAATLQARVAEECFEYLEAPVRLVSGFDVPFPSPKMENWYLPDADRVLDAIDTLHWED